MSLPSALKCVVALLVVLAASGAAAQGGPPPYGMPISLENAKKAAAAAVVEARKNNWTMAVAITETSAATWSTSRRWTAPRPAA